MTDERFDEAYLPLDEAELQAPDLDEEKRFGAACRSLLQSEAYQRVVSHMRQGLCESLEVVPLRDLEGLQVLQLRLKAVNDMDLLLRDAADTGMMAAQQLVAKHITGDR